MRHIVMALVSSLLTISVLAHAEESKNHDLGATLQAAVASLQGTLEKARFSPRWLFTYAEELQFHGLSGECVKVAEAAKNINDAFAADATAKLKDSALKNQTLAYTTAMGRALEAEVVFCRSGDGKMSEQAHEQMSKYVDEAVSREQDLGQNRAAAFGF